MKRGSHADSRSQIELPDGRPLAILYENRSVLALDKPPGWLLAPESWQRTSRNLQSFLAASVRAREPWARARNLRFIRFVHRLDAETSGIVLLAKSPGAVAAYTQLFEERKVRKIYLAVVHGNPGKEEWSCQWRIAPDPVTKGRVTRNDRTGKEAVTEFKTLEVRGGRTLVEARPITGRTHQIRVHLAWGGNPVVGDMLYGKGNDHAPGLGLRAVEVRFRDPFTREAVAVHADTSAFLESFGFAQLPEATGPGPHPDQELKARTDLQMETNGNMEVRNPKGIKPHSPHPRPQ